MYKLTSPIGAEIDIPEFSAENTETFTADEIDTASAYYQTNGYAVVRNVLKREECDALREAFDVTVKRYSGYIYRQTTANPEKNLVNEFGFIMNPVLNLQSLPSAEFEPLKSLAMAAFAGEKIRSIGRTLTGEDVKLVQSMYFEGNAETWPHQDTYYLDSERIGRMFGCWYALEDIDAGAGRFFVVPGSHNIEMEKNGGDVDYAFNHNRYKDKVRALLTHSSLQIRAPFLAKGDVLIWNSRTIHGSLKTTRPKRSRASLTAHYIPASHRFLQFQSRIRKLNLREFNGMLFHCPKDLERLGPKVVMQVETTFPKLFQTAKKFAIKALVR